MIGLKNSVPCDYCGLPAFQGGTEFKPNQDVPFFCCLGCRIAAGLMKGRDAKDENQSALARLALAIFFSMNVMVFTMVLWTWNVHQLEPDGRVQTFRELLRYACLLFSCPVVILLGDPLVESSWESCKQRIFTTDLLLLIGVVAAFCYSVLSLLLGLPHVYFEVACMILIAVTLGKWLEATAKLKATDALRSLRQLLPSSVRVLSESNETVIPLEDVQINDRLRILAGERIPVDGRLESQASTIDEQVITGESIPKLKNRGDSLYGGSLNLSGEVIVHATSSAKDGAIARLASAVESATQLNCQSIRLADRLATWFAPLILIVCIFAFTYNLENGFQHALMASLAVVLFACPCALGIATPLALWVAINTGTRHGVLFRNGDAVMRLARIRSIAIDKTGTITSGNLNVSSQIFDSSHDPNLISLIAKRMSAASNHVLSNSVFNSIDCPASLARTASFSIEQHAEFPGKGLTGSISGAPIESSKSKVMLGSIRLALELGFQIPAKLEREIASRSEQLTVCIAFDKQVHGVFFLEETLRPETVEVTRRLKAMRLDLTILTGDQQSHADEIAKKIDVVTIGELLPEDKSNQLANMAQPVAMVGDGVNDSLALAVADVGIALDCGADVSRDAADVCLLGNSIANLPWAIELARAARCTIRRNLVWAVGYNAIGIGFAATGNLNPILAAIAMVASSLFVLVNSLRLQAFGSTQTIHTNAKFDVAARCRGDADVIDSKGNSTELQVASS